MVVNSLYSLMKAKRRKTTNDILWYLFFVLEQIFGGRYYWGILYKLISKKAVKSYRRSIPSPYKPINAVSFFDWFDGDIPQEMEGSWFIPVQSEHSAYLKPPHSFDESIYSNFIDINQYHSFPRAYLCCLKNGRIVNKQGSIISFDNLVYSDFTMEYGKDIKECEIFVTYINRPSYLSGNFATISSSSTNYFHWMFDILPRVALLKNYIHEIDYFFVPKGIAKYQKTMLNSVGISNQKIWEIGDSDHFLCEKLFVPSLPVRELMMANWVCDFLRKSFLPSNSSIPFRMIYISRGDAFYRNIVNENELISLLKKKGFEIFQMSGLTFTEQVKICAESKIIVSPHGAGLSNTVFCQNAIIFELFAPSYVNTCYWKLSNQVGNRYYCMLGEDVDCLSPVVWKDFKIDMAKFKVNLELILKIA